MKQGTDSSIPVPRFKHSMYGIVTYIDPLKPPHLIGKMASRISRVWGSIPQTIYSTPRIRVRALKRQGCRSAWPSNPSSWRRSARLLWPCHPSAPTPTGTDMTGQPGCSEASGRRERRARFGRDLGLSVTHPEQHPTTNRSPMVRPVRAQPKPSNKGNCRVRCSTVD